jgi:hypothetical protein
MMWWRRRRYAPAASESFALALRASERPLLAAVRSVRDEAGEA